LAKLIYSGITSLDGYVADDDSSFDWSVPDEELHTFVNDLERPIGTYLYGRRMYEVMVYWETAHTLADQPAFVRDGDAARTWTWPFSSSDQALPPQRCRRPMRWCPAQTRRHLGELGTMRPRTRPGRVAASAGQGLAPRVSNGQGRCSR